MNNLESYTNIIEDFRNYSIVIKNLSEGSINTIIDTLNNFLKFINDYKFNYDNITDITANDLRTITNNDIYSYIFDLADRNCASATRIHRTDHLKTFFTYLFKIRHNIFKQPISEVKTEKRMLHQLPNYLSLEDAKKMSNLYRNSNKTVEVRTNAIINLCLNAGLRINEVINLRISEINFNENTFIVHGKGNKERIGYLNAKSKEALLKYYEIRKDLTPASKKDSDILFLSVRNKKMSDKTIREYIKNSYTKANIDNKNYSVHTLRHTCATLLYRSGVDIKTVQDVLGHASINTTSVYTHLHNEDVKNSMLEHPLAHFKMQEALSYC